MARSRVEGLDYLRGILAFAVMIYHYQTWTHLNLPSQPKLILEKTGLYAVSTFYVLSGMALYIVYNNRDVDKRFLTEFSIKRVARIVPLFWLVTTLALAMMYRSHTMPPKTDILLCYSLLFSWIKPTAYFSAGAWSIGNEWTFYMLFPLLLLTWRKSQRLGILFVVSAIAIGGYFAFFKMGNLRPDAAWPIYIQPLNQFFLFACGFALAAFIHRRQLAPLNRNQCILWIIGTIALFCLLSIFFSASESIGGLGRFLFSAICILWCYVAGVIDVQKDWATRVLGFLGRTSYAIYLLHPLVYNSILIVATKLHIPVNGSADEIIAFGVAVPVSLLMAHLSFKWLESPCIAMGKRLDARLKEAAQKRAGDFASPLPVAANIRTDTD